MERISLQNGVIKTPQNTRIGIRYKSKDGQTKEAHIVADIVKSHYIAQFEEDNVDFVIWIDCLNHAEQRKFNYKVSAHDRTYSFIVDNGKYRELKALVAKGQHLRFTSNAVSNLKFDLCYSTFIKMSIDVLGLNLLHPIKMTISVPYNETLKNVKKEIVSKLSKNPQNENLELYAGCGNIRMDDMSTLDKYNVRDGEIIFVQFTPTYRNEMYSVFVRTIDRRRLEIQVPSSRMTVRELQNAIRKKDNGSIVFDTAEHQITCIGKSLNELFTLECYGIEPNTLLHIEPKAVPRKPMRLFLKTANGNMMAFRASTQDTIASLKTQINQKCGARVDQQRLTYEGGDLDNQKTLGFYRICHESTLQFNVAFRCTTAGGTSRGGLEKRELSENTADQVQQNVSKYKSNEKGSDRSGEKTNQKLRQKQFVRDKNINIEPFVIEMRLQSENNNLF